MTTGVGGKLPAEVLSNLTCMSHGVEDIAVGEFRERLGRLQQHLREQGAAAAYLHAGTNLRYFTGLHWHPSERMVAAIVPAEGELCYIAPRFELDTLRDYWVLEAPIQPWDEHESPYSLVAQTLQRCSGDSPKLLVDEVTPFFVFDGLRDACPAVDFRSAQPTTQACRSRKSPTELAILQRAHQMTWEVQRAAASILRPGITTTEVVAFIDEAHRQVGATGGSSFCIVLFGVATSFPHGVKEPQVLQEQDWVLVDTGCLLHGYNSDITRCYCFGDPTPEQREAWNHEKAAQLAAFEAAELGAPCQRCDDAARKTLEGFGYGPGYGLPGLPHRTGHGCGLDIHEGPHLVRGETTPLVPGMVFSCEPMLVLPGRMGVRLEDHFYMGEAGPVWFTRPAHSIDAPFAE